MIYVTEHAVKRYKERISDIKDKTVIKDKIMDAILSYQKLINKTDSKIKAYIKENIVAITRQDGKDEIVITIESITFINCWWNKTEEGAC